MTPGQEWLELSEIYYRKVYGRNGELLGRVDDVIIQSDPGRVDRIRLAMLTAGETRVALIEIPWSQFTLTEGKLELDVSSATLKRVTERNEEE
ncbi:MAG: PRC-barrel domain-containing protein [Xanthomonadales bacterium]|nr:PRC-barrel domain-containing protein [Gammaproteobacteria bacterium]NNE05308.1 PRC-barrel domain-containing protein [Xanthomonadales bacterium]NNL95204.1 PRC-barrel domain-containing protein [Xanthomonadales bacterium]